MSSGPAYVYFENTNPDTGKKEYTKISPKDLTRSKLCGLSIYASKRLGYGKGTGKSELILNEGWFDKATATKILKAMVNQNIMRPVPLSVNNLEVSSFDELIAVYRTVQHLDLKWAFKGTTDLRDTICQKVKKGPMKFKWFESIIEQLGFDAGLAKLVKNHVMYGEVKGGDLVSPEFYKIRQYSIWHNDEYGLWDELIAIREGIRETMDADEEVRKLGKAKAKGKAWESEDYGKDFPSLPDKN